MLISIGRLARDGFDPPNNVARQLCSHSDQRAGVESQPDISSGEPGMIMVANGGYEGAVLPARFGAVQKRLSARQNQARPAATKATSTATLINLSHVLAAKLVTPVSPG